MKAILILGEIGMPQIIMILIIIIFLILIPIIFYKYGFNKGKDKGFREGIEFNNKKIR